MTKLSVRVGLRNLARAGNSHNRFRCPEVVYTDWSHKYVQNIIQAIFYFGTAVILPGFSPFCLKTVTDESLQLDIGSLDRGQTARRQIYNNGNDGHLCGYVQQLQRTRSRCSDYVAGWAAGELWVGYQQAQEAFLQSLHARSAGYPSCYSVGADGFSNVYSSWITKLKSTIQF